MNPIGSMPLGAVLPFLALCGPGHAQEPARPIRPMPAASGQQQQQPSQADLIKKRDEKLALEVFKKAPWTFDYDAAREQAKKEGKLIFAYFSRSYAA